RGHYSPKLSRPLVSKLYHAAKERNVPMTVLADQIMAAALGMKQPEPVAVVQEQPASPYPQP
ncbi:MAG: hypothetical protein NTY01_08195, partial [Verrucomicrobia bacterium]|nr:hypothetical protein [Verrucomicrobiota bacterium]